MNDKIITRTAKKVIINMDLAKKSLNNTDFEALKHLLELLDKR